MKLIQEIKFVGKATYKPFVEFNPSRCFIRLGQTDKTSEKRVSSDVVVQRSSDASSLMHKFEIHQRNVDQS